MGIESNRELFSVACVFFREFPVGVGACGSEQSDTPPPGTMDLHSSQHTLLYGVHLLLLSIYMRRYVWCSSGNCSLSFSFRSSCITMSLFRTTVVCLFCFIFFFFFFFLFSLFFFIVCLDSCCVLVSSALAFHLLWIATVLFTLFYSRLCDHRIVYF